MKFKNFAELERYYNGRYNYWTDRLNAPGVSEFGRRKLEKKVMHYDRKLAELHKHAEGLTDLPALPAERQRA